MEQLLLEILAILRSGKSLDSRELGKLIDSHNALVKSAQRAYSKKKILPYYLRVKEQDPARWASWGVDDELEARLMRTLRMKPRRTASGVATITVITKPWKCSSDCLYCPNDLRMPKSYLHAEPACQRAERNFFDPYLQVASRLRALEQMGHLCDKVELIVLGGTWSDYPISYQTWFVSELFRALNEAPHTDESVRERRGFYRGCGISCDEAELAGFVEPEQKRIAAGGERFNAAFDRLYGNSKA
ncbi:MAG: histone acetyltransferase, partial [Coriobacteriales bacterium]|nr:histone acetyltransferase [Coriobacteriales bacterium]